MPIDPDFFPLGGVAGVGLALGEDALDLFAQGVILGRRELVGHGGKGTVGEAWSEAGWAKWGPEYGSWPVPGPQVPSNGEGHPHLQSPRRRGALDAHLH